MSATPSPVNATAAPAIEVLSPSKEAWRVFRRNKAAMLGLVLLTLVIVTMLVEIAQISPPDGTVMYVLQGMRPKGGPITDVFAGVMPFLGVYMLAVLLMMLFPGIATWLPQIMG